MKKIIRVTVFEKERYDGEWPPEPEPDELDAFLYQLENNIERAESPDWCVLHLNVQQGENLLRLIRERTQAT